VVEAKGGASGRWKGSVLEKKSARDWFSMSLSSDWPCVSKGVVEPLKKSLVKVSAGALASSSLRTGRAQDGVQPNGGGSLSLMAGRGRPVAGAASNPTRGGCDSVSSLAACLQAWSWKGRAQTEASGSRRRLAATGSESCCNAVVGSCDVRNDVQCSAVQWAYAKERFGLRAGCGVWETSNARTAVLDKQSLLPADIADVTSPAALDGRS
jgi:hypothetical protein